MAQVCSCGTERLDPREREVSGLAPGLVVEVRRIRLARQQLARPECTLRGQHDGPIARLEHDGLVPGRVTWRRDDANAFDDLFVALHESEPLGGNRGPVGNGVSRISRFGVLVRLDEDRRVEQSLLTAVVEVHMRENHRGDVGRLEPHRPQRVVKGDDLRPVPRVDHRVAGPDTGVDEDHAVAMTNHPSVHGKRLESGVFRVPVRHRGHPSERQALDRRQRSRRHHRDNSDRRKLLQKGRTRKTSPVSVRQPELIRVRT